MPILILFFFLMYAQQEKAIDIRQQIVDYVLQICPSTAMVTSNNYSTSDEYYMDTIQSVTYGGLCELVAAERIYYDFVFEVYGNGNGIYGCPVRRLCFLQILSNGHCDTYLSHDEQVPELVGS